MAFSLLAKNSWNFLCFDLKKLKIQKFYYSHDKLVTELHFIQFGL